MNAEDDPIQNSRGRFKTEVFFYSLDGFVGQLENWFSNFKDIGQIVFST